MNVFKVANHKPGTMSLNILSQFMNNNSQKCNLNKRILISRKKYEIINVLRLNIYIYLVFLEQTLRLKRSRTEKLF